MRLKTRTGVAAGGGTKDLLRSRECSTLAGVMTTWEYTLITVHSTVHFNGLIYTPFTEIIKKTTVVGKI
jgi:hypothetical protein